MSAPYNTTNDGQNSNVLNVGVNSSLYHDSDLSTIANSENRLHNGSHASDADGAADDAADERATESDLYRESLQKLWMTPKMVLALFTCLMTCIYYDRGATSPAAKYMAVDGTIAGHNTTLSDAQVGAINSVFVFGYIAWAPLAIALQARISSISICCIGTAAWIVAVLVGAFSQSYEMLLAGRACVGIAEASFAGFSLTIIDEIAPRASRSLWISIFYATIPLATAAGIAINGVITTLEIGPMPGWRFGFVVETVPMCIVLALMIAMPREYNVRKDDRVEGGRAGFQRMLEADPELRARHEARAADDVPFFQAIKGLFTNVNYLIISGGYAAYTFVLGALSFFAIQMLTQSPMGVSTIEASLLMGATTAFIGLFASGAGGYYVDRVGGSEGWEGVYRCCAFMAASIAIGFPSGLIALFVENFVAFALLFVWTVWWLFIITGPINCAALSVVPPALRPYSVSFNILIIHALGDLPSTTIVGTIGDAYDGGCKDFDTDERSCLAHNSTSGVGRCVFVPPPMKGERARCVNDMELTIALRIAWIIFVLAFLLWLIAALRIKRHRSVNGVPNTAAAADAEKAEGQQAAGFSRVQVKGEERGLLSGEESE